MTELWLFIIVGAIAVFAAVMMLLSENAVYSALFLIVTMGCLAFLFLLLDAPFLAMIQITVYAGAIMVLFIFVIMLLGAERLGAHKSRFGWLTPASIVLSLVLLLALGIAVATGGVDRQAPPDDAPLLRVVNAASDVGPVDVFVDDTVVASGLAFDEASTFIPVLAGEHTITFHPTNGDQFSGTFSFGPDTAQTLIAFGAEGNVTLGVIPSDLSTPANRSARVTFFNAYPNLESVNLYDLGANGQIDTTTQGAISDRLLFSFGPGDVSEALTFEEGSYAWAFVTPNGDILHRIVSDEFGRNYDVERGGAELIVLAAQRSPIDDSLNPSVAAFVDEAEPSFGGPEAIGRDLFTRFLLPFELVSLLLLAAMIGAIVLTHKQDAPVRDRSQLRRRVSRPLASVIATQVGHDVTQPENDTPALPPADTRAPAGD
jgi:NADH-quinone oxidoreductase subunit J